MGERTIADVLSPTPTRPFSYTAKFDELCPYFLAEGMTYKEYWEGTADITRHYVKAINIKKKQQNENAWLIGLYVYRAIGNLSPIFNVFSKTAPKPYLEEPIPFFTDDDSARAKKNMENIKSMVEVYAKNFNQKWKQKKEGDSR